MSGPQHGTYVSLDGGSLIPECISRFSAGTRVEVRVTREGVYAVQTVSGDPLRIFGEETWLAAV